MTKQKDMTTIQIPSLEKMPQAVEQFIAAMADRKVFAFYGKMGAEKTTFIKELCNALGTDDEVNSPTFAIVNEYATPQGPIFHFDFYRIKKEEEVYDIGYEDYVYSGNLCFMEWPELIEDMLPEDTVRVNIVENEDGTRTLTMYDPQ